MSNIPISWINVERTRKKMSLTIIPIVNKGLVAAVCFVPVVCLVISLFFGV